MSERVHERQHGHDHAGHEHDDHGHDHAGHHHDHDHGHERSIECAWAHVDLESHTHEQAATVTATFHLKPACQLAFDDLVAIMERIAEASEASGGIVGHIKGFAREGGSFAHASVTASALPAVVEGDCAAPYGNAAEIQLVAIVMLVDPESLERIVEEAITAAGA